MAMLIRTRFARFVCLLAPMVGTFVSAASAETLMMPNREAVKDVQTVVWGITTQANGTPYTIDFGDGSAIQNGTVADRSYIAFNYTYYLAGSPEITATLTVGTGPSAEVATVKIQTWDPADPLVASQLRNININMAIQDGLRYLWVAQSDRANQFPANAMTHWDGSNPNSWTALVTLAFENQGYGIPNDNSTPTGLYQKYIVQRGLNFVINSLGKITASPTSLQPQQSCQWVQIYYGPNWYDYYWYYQCTTNPNYLQSGTQPAGDPRVGVPNDADLGVLLFGESIDRSAYGTSVAMLPIAASGAMNRTVSGIPGTGSGGFVVGRKYGEVLQRLSNALVWGQIDSGSGQGGWMYSLNPGPSNTIVSSTSGAYASDGSTVGWGVLALLDAEAAGIAVPAFAKSQFQIAYNNAINSDGSFDYNTDQNTTSNGSANVYRNMTRAGVGLEGLYYTGVQGGANFVANAPGQAALTFLSTRWGGGGGFGDYTGTCGSTGQNKGCAYAMFNIFKGLKLQGVTNLPGAIFRPADANHAANDWYADYQDWLVSNQTSANDLNGGYWGSMRFSCCANDTAPNSALAELVLAPVALVLPDATKFSTVGLAPLSGTSPTGLTHTLTAHAESSGTPGTPVAGAHVVFKGLTGSPNVGILGAADTDSGGNASITYTDLGAGTDTIRAFIGTTLASNTVTMDWTIRTVTASFTANNKWYDGNTGASVAACSLPDVLPADAPFVTCSLVATFDTANVGTGKTVTGSSIVLGGTRAANYALDSTAPAPTTTADIRPIPATVTAGSTSKTYGVALTFLGTEFTSSGFIAGDSVSSVTLTSAGAVASATVAGSPYPITPSAAVGTGLGNYSISYADGTLTVNPATLTVTANNVSKVYGTTTTITGTEFTTSGLKNGDTVASASIASTGSPAAAVVNAYPITISSAVGTGLGNYTVSYVNGTLTVTAATLTVTANSTSKTYGSTTTFAGTEFTTSGLANGDTVTSATIASTGGAATATASTYPITITGATGTGLSNYTMVYVNGTLTVNPKALTITANSASKTYGQTRVFASTEFTTSGLVNGDTVTGAAIASAGSPAATAVGMYPITIVGAAGTGLGNYTIGYVNGTLTVNPALLTVTATNRIKGFGQTMVFAGTEFTTLGLVNGDTVTSAAIASPGSPAAAAVGTYPITIAGAAGTGLGNYTISYTNGSLTVVSASPSVGSLWPPNHKMVPITIAVANGGAPASCAITNVTSNEPINGLGDGDTAPDWLFTPGTLTLNLRSERAGGGTGRVYTVFVTCTLPSGSSTVTTTTVGVPHNQ